MLNGNSRALDFPKKYHFAAGVFMFIPVADSYAAVCRFWFRRAHQKSWGWTVTLVKCGHFPARRKHAWMVARCYIMLHHVFSTLGFSVQNPKWNGNLYQPAPNMALTWQPQPNQWILWRVSTIQAECLKFEKIPGHRLMGTTFFRGET